MEYTEVCRRVESGSYSSHAAQAVQILLENQNEDSHSLVTSEDIK